MPQSITQYRVFIGSPGGLEKEREAFRGAVEKCSLQHGDSKDVRFHPVGWEDATGGAERPQGLINDDLKKCDYAVFVLHDRWGSPTGNGYTSGTKEEWDIAVELFNSKKIRNIALFFKDVDAKQLKDPGDQLKQVLAFKKEVEDSKRYLFHTYSEISKYTDKLDGHLAKWLVIHEKQQQTILSGQLLAANLKLSVEASMAIVKPSYLYWLNEADTILRADSGDKRAALFCAQKSLECSSGDEEWAKAKQMCAKASFWLGDLDQALEIFSDVSTQNFDIGNPILQGEIAKAIYNKGVTLGLLQRSLEEIATYGKLISRFGNSQWNTIREQVAKGTLNKGVAHRDLQQFEQALAAYEEVISRFTEAPENSLQECVAKAMLYKGELFVSLQRPLEAIAIYDKITTKFEGSKESQILIQVASATLNKGVELHKLNLPIEAIKEFDYNINNFIDRTEQRFPEIVAKSLLNKGITLEETVPNLKVIAVYDELIDLHKSATDKVIKSLVKRAKRYRNALMRKDGLNSVRKTNK